MPHPTLSLIEQRASVNLFDPNHELQDAEIEDLVRLATRAPTAYNLQNWRFIAVRSHREKARLRSVANNQAKVTEAAVTFILCGLLPNDAVLPERLGPFVQAGFMSKETAQGWQQAVKMQYADVQTARDEAVRSATLAAATLIYASEAKGLASGPMVGFDPQGVAREFGLGAHEVPVLLLAVGRAMPGNWPQKSRRPLAEVLQIL